MLFDHGTRIGFIGAGMVGKSLAVALSRRGYSVVAVASRSMLSAQVLADLVSDCQAFDSTQSVADTADFVFVTSPDDSILQVVTDVRWHSEQRVVHCSGVASLDILEPAAQRGAIVGTFHPLQVFSSVESALESMPGATFAIEGDSNMRSVLKDLAMSLGGNPIFLKSQDKPLYHASIVMMGGLLSGMVGAIADLWQNFGICRAEAVGALTPIIQGNVTALNTNGLPDAIAGPYARGDIGTVRKHLMAIKTHAPDILHVYCEMALSGLPYAVEKGNVSVDRATDIKKLLVEVVGDR